MTADGKPVTTDAVRTLLPFLEPTRGGPVEQRVEAAPLDQLRRFYLFSVGGIVIPDDEKDIHRYVEKRFQSALSAAHRAGWTVLTAITGSTLGVRVALGFMASSSTDTSEPYVFERILRGLMPGLGVRFVETAKVEELLDEKSFGGIVAGVPTLKIDDERQRFSIPAVIRSLYGEDYSLLILSKPISAETVSKQLQRVWEVRDRCHEHAHQSRVREDGESSSWHKEESKNESSSQSNTKGGSLIVANASKAMQLSSGTSSTSGEGGDKHWSESLSQEQQDSVALELERLAERYAERLLKAANVGEWETTITFATRTAAGRDILAGTLMGELAKPSTDVFPPRVYYETLDKHRPLLLPGLDDLSGVFPRSLASYLTGEELASIAAPPVEQLPGYDIRRTPSLSLTDMGAGPTGKSRVLGSICDHGRALEGVNVEIDSRDLAKHLFVCGLTGTGKTTTVKEILAKCGVPFLVLESAKRDYRQLLGVDAFRDTLKVYTVGDGAVSPLRMNPFYVMPGASPLAHIDFLKAIFNASFSLYGPMPYILEKCIHNVYLKRGWDLTRGCHPRLCGADGELDPDRYSAPETEHLFPTIPDLKDEVQEYVKSVLEYGGELSDNIRTAIVTRLESLCVGAKGLLFGTSKPLDVATLLKHPTVLELEALSDDDDKAFFVGMMLTFISEHRQCSNPALDPFAPRQDSLQHLLVIEEAHRLLKNVTQERQTEQLGNPRGKAVEFFANVISEMRSMGQGVAVVEQIPTKILPDVVKNTNAKIVHRLVAADDQALVSSSLGLEPEEAIYLTSLKTGHALYLKEGMQRPVEVEVHATVPSTRISHERVRKAMQSDATEADVDAARAADIRNLLSGTGDAFALKALCSLGAGGKAMAGNAAAAALSAIEHELVSMDRAFTRSATTSYLCDRLVALLVHGVFRMADAKGVAENVAGMIAGKPGSAEELLGRLGPGWRADDAKGGLVRRLRELVLDRTLRANLKREDRAAIDKITSSHFLVDVPDARQAVVDQVVARLGGDQWTQ